MSEQKQRRKPINACDLMTKEFPPTRWLAEGLIPVGLTLLAGDSKAGKSWFALLLAICVVTGRLFLGRYKVDTGDVYGLFLEDPQKRVQGRILKLNRGKPLTSRRLDLETLPEMGDEQGLFPQLYEGGMECITAWIDEHADTAKLIIIDVWTRVSPEQKSSDVYKEQYKAMAPLQALAAARNIAIVVLMHTNKDESKHGLNRVNGTNAYVGAADTIMILERKMGATKGKLEVTGRDIENESVRHLGFNGGLWSFEKEQTSDEPAVTTGTRQAILAALTKKPLTALEVFQRAKANGSDVKQGTIKRTLARMANEIDSGARKNARGLYELDNDDPAPATNGHVPSVPSVLFGDGAEPPELL